MDMEDVDDTEKFGLKKLVMPDKILLEKEFLNVRDELEQRVDNGSDSETFWKGQFRLVDWIGDKKHHYRLFLDKLDKKGKSVSTFYLLTLPEDIALEIYNW